MFNIFPKPETTGCTVPADCPYVQEMSVFALDGTHEYVAFGLLVVWALYLFFDIARKLPVFRAEDRVNQLIHEHLSGVMLPRTIMERLVASQDVRYLMKKRRFYVPSKETGALKRVRFSTPREVANYYLKRAVL